MCVFVFGFDEFFEKVEGREGGEGDSSREERGGRGKEEKKEREEGSKRKCERASERAASDRMLIILLFLLCFSLLQTKQSHPPRSKLTSS